MEPGYLSIPKQTLKRLPFYYQYLLSLRQRGLETVSAPAIAKALGWSDVLVRKDLAWAGATGGRPRTGFRVDQLLDSLRRCLGYNNIHDAVLVGAGKLGHALLHYRGFSRYGLHIVAAFDNDPALWGQQQSPPVFPTEKLPDLTGRLGIKSGIITVPAAGAQQVCDLLVESGILAIWNFAPVQLKAPPHILILNENMAASLAQIRLQLKEEEAVSF